MQVSVETTSSIERRMTIGVPAKDVDVEVNKRLQETARSVKLNGFRPGKAPMQVVKRRYGQSVRQEVVGEVMRNAYVEAIEKEALAPAGYPRFEPKNLDEGKDLEFVAVFEVFPEIKLGDLSAVSVEKEEAEIKDKDIKNMLDILRRQGAPMKSVKRKSKKKDVLTVDYKGFIGDEAFEGGTASDQKITLGSGQMIPGFEDGLVGAKAGENVELNVTFPSEYQNAELAGKDARFEVEVKDVQEADLPELNAEFFEKFGVTCETEDEFKSEIVKNMERELKQAVSNKVKQQVIDALLEGAEFEVPSSLVSQEIDRMRYDAVRQFGGGNQFKPESLPAEIFKDQADKRVRTGLVFNALVKQAEIKVTPENIEEKLQELSATYQEPQEVVDYYKGNREAMSQLEASVLEDLVVDHVLASASVKVSKVSYEDAVKPPQPAAAKAKEKAE